MKHSSSTHFTGIPNTNTLAGQWMTFSHMSNHYRKLLNVKPRVDTGFMGYHGGSCQNLTMQSSKLGKKMGCLNTKAKKSTNTSSCTCNNLVCPSHRNPLTCSSHPDRLNKYMGGGGEDKPSKMKPTKLSSNKNVKKTPTKQPPQIHAQPPQDYQVVFGPSSLRSSTTDAFMSDTESTVSNDKPPYEEPLTIGVTEKIRRFLDNLHKMDLTVQNEKRVKNSSLMTNERPITVPRKSDRARKCMPPPLSSSAMSIDNDADIDPNLRLSRHSKCFLPCPPKSPKKHTKTTMSTVRSGEFGKRGMPKRVMEPISSCVHRVHYSPIKTAGPEFIDENCTIQKSEKKVGKSRQRAESIGSIGTIFGSEELTAEDLYNVSIKDICATLENGLSSDETEMILRIEENRKKQILEQYSNTTRKFEKTLSQHNPLVDTPTQPSSTKLLKSSSMISLVPTNSTKNSAGVQSNNNKDSSRDSAYGFSSGESRITTRESTPEKRYHRLKSGGASSSHAYLDDKPCKDVPLEDSQNTMGNQRPNSASESKRHHSKSSKERHHSRTKAKSSLNSNRKESDKYITFLADVTQDIVRKGIYTNKGLKTLLKSHLEDNKQLNHDKLSDMLERLRIDLGIPKDDALDRIEFGYGSVSNSPSTRFFYTLSDTKVGTDPVPLSGSSSAEDHTSIPSTSSSLTTVVPPPIVALPLPSATPTTTTGFSSSGPNTSSNRSTTTTEEGGDILSVRSSDREDHEKNSDEGDDYELSLSESEVTQALKLEGLDEGTIANVVGILKH